MSFNRSQQDHKKDEEQHDAVIVSLVTAVAIQSDYENTPEVRREGYVRVGRRGNNIPLMISFPGRPIGRNNSLN